MLSTAYRLDTPSAVRYPRGTGPGVAIKPDLQVLPVGKGEVRREGHNVAILAFGSMLAPSLRAADQIDATVANMRFVKPLDEELVLKLAREHALLVTVEENVVQGGAGSAVAECLARHGLHVTMLHLGLPDEFLEQGDPAQMLADCGLDAVGIARAIQERSSN
jgi:1-deoxy-D-xylulose-5-phosphate synthase